MKQTDDASMIDGPTRSGLRGRMDKLADEYRRKALALQTAIDIIDADDRSTALTLAPKKFLKAINHRNGNGDYAPVPKKARKKKKGTRLTVDERKGQLATWLITHPDGGSSDDIGGALGWDRNMVYKYAPMVAKASGTDDNGRTVWVLRKSVSHKKAPVEKKRTIRKPKQERLDQIQGFLQRNPSATTSSIARVVGMKPHSTFIKLLRTIARPAGPTKARQAIQWVMQ